MTAAFDVSSALASVKQDFPLLARTIDDNPIVYLDSAATTLKPRAVVEAMNAYYYEHGANIHRGKHYLSEEASTRFEESRQTVARFLGASSNEVVFVRNTTEALNVIAAGIKWKPGDRVIAFADSHHSNILPWRRYAETKLVPLDAQGTTDLVRFEKMLEERPRLVALSHCSNVTGVYMPVAEMAAMAHRAGALVVLDAAQSAPHRKLDVNALGVDFLALSAHKMLGPTGVGILYGRFELLNELEPVYVGGGAVDWVDLDGHRLRKAPHRFEAGTPDIAGVYGLAAAIRYLEKLGFDTVGAHDLALGEQLVALASERDYLQIIGPGAGTPRAAILSLAIKGREGLADVARMLSDSYGIMCRSGHLCAQPLVDAQTSGEVLRASAYVYNSPSEILQFFDALDEIHRRFRSGKRTAG